MKRRLFTALAALTVLLAMATPVAVANTPTDNVPGDNVNARPNTDDVSFERAEASPVRVDQLKGAKDGIFIIRLADEPVATYRGGVSGFQATSAVAVGSKRLNAQAPESQAYAGYLAARQNALVERMESTFDRSVEVVFTYQFAFNGLAIDLSVEEARKVARMPGVASISPDRMLQPDTDNGPAWIGAPGMWGTDCGDYCGEGIVVGVLDSGINPENPSFDEVGPVDGYVHVNPLGADTYLGVCDDTHPDYDPGFPCNDKLIGAYSFLDLVNPYDDDGHGSHTASTAAGNFVAAEVVGPTITLNRDISGVAPHANIISYDVCDDDGCPNSATNAGIEQAVIDGVDVINYSIGTDAAIDPWTDENAVLYLAAREAGVFVATSAGNDGPGSDTLGTPAVAPWLMSVGATTHDRQYTNGLIDMVGGDTPPPVDMEGLGVTDSLGSTPIVWAGAVPSGETGTPELCGVGALGDFNSPWDPGTFTGEIVVCERGTFGRVEMGENVLAAGAGGYVLIDNGGGLVGDAHALPGVHISADDGVLLKAWLATGAGHMASISGATLDEAAGNGDIMAGFSSRGSNRVVPIVSPTVVAPGVDIIAADGVGGAISWGFNSGTSMASPHVAGAAALLIQANPGWSPAEVQSALMLTATTSVLKEDAATPADAFDIGSGRIQVDVAMSSPLIMHETIANYEAANPALAGDPTTLNLASAANNKCVLECEWTRTVEATTDGTWDVAASDDGNFDLTVSPLNFSLLEGETQVITITADVSTSVVDEWFFGDISITGTGDDMHMPVAVKATRGELPNRIDIWARRDAGSVNQHDVTSIEIELLTLELVGLTEGHQQELELEPDSNNASPYDDLDDGIWWMSLEVPAGTERFVVETFDSTAPDLDLFLGTGDTPSEATEVCSSTSGSAVEYCNLWDPTGTMWILIQNWDGSGAPTDSFTMSYALVGEDEGNMLVEGPPDQPALEPFDMQVFWDLDDPDVGSLWYGAFSVGTHPSTPGNVGRVPVDLMRHEDDVTKTADDDNPFPTETVTFTITVEPNPGPVDFLNYEIVDHVPDGLTYVPGSATGGLELRSDGALTWEGAMEKPGDAEYLMTTSDDDPFCAAPLAGFDGDDDPYVDLEAFGLYAESDLTGDSTAFYFETPLAAPLSFYGVNRSTGIGGDFIFTDDGFASYDLDSWLGGPPWVWQVIPDPADPSGLAAMAWFDFQLFYDGPTNQGVTTAFLTDAGGFPIAALVEYDNLEPWGGGPALLDMQIIHFAGIDDTPGAYELAFAYDNVAFDFPATIGLESFEGTEAVAYLNDDLLSTTDLDPAGFAICFDYKAPPRPAKVLTYQATVDEGTDGTYVTNTAWHVNDNPGSKQEPASVEIALGDVDAPEFGPDALTTHDKLSSSLRLEWTEATDNVAVFAYDVYVNDVMVGTVGPSTFDFFVDGLVPESFNEFAVVARDEVGNESDPAEASATMSTDFVDDNFSIFESDIEWMSGRGITFGCNPPTNDMFCPDDNLTRGQLAAFIARALDLPPGPDAFTDDDGNIFEGDINAIAAAGIAHGCAVDSYCPNDLATRGQLAAMFKIAFGLPDAGDDYFDDDNGHPFEDAINSMFEAEITFGCGANAYCPDDPLTRGMVAAFFRRAFRYNGWW